jgi:FkbM family methyltransferase
MATLADKAMLNILVQRILQETPDPVVFELGACDGRYTNDIFFACFKGKPTIYSFEPDPRNIPLCKKRIPASINFVPAAAGNVTGKVPFYLASPQINGEIGSSSISPFKDQTAAFPWCKMTGTVDVDCWRLDDFCAQRGHACIDFIFADVQGAERLLIEGAREILKATRYFWTEFEGVKIKDEGTCYEHSSSLERLSGILGADWEIAAVIGGDALLVNTKCSPANPHAPVDLLYSPMRLSQP